MAGPLDYSTTAASNTTVGGVNIAEGMAPGSVNNAMRAMMADSRKWQLDWSGVTTAGSSNAYTMTCNQGITAYADGMRFSFRADRNNTGAATLNIDSRGAKALRKVSAGGLAALAADDVVAKAIYDVVFNAADDVFIIAGGMSLSSLGITATATELNYVDGATSAIQTQLDAKGPLPQTGAGTGQWRLVSTGLNAPFTLPAGGTWAYHIIPFTSTNVLAVGADSSVAAGGTTIIAADPARQYVALCWRIT